jgi:uncharacterized membrane protein YkvA (DUF1232 family)
MNTSQITRPVRRERWLHAQASRWKRGLISLAKRAHLLSVVLRHPLVPWPAKLAAGCAVAYVLSPIQLIPTVIPLIGQLDDLFVLFLGTKLVRRFTPDKVLAECEARAQSVLTFQRTKWERVLRVPKERRVPAA